MNNIELGKYWDKKWAICSEEKHNPFAEYVIKHCPPCSKKLKLLEIGCGDGRDTKYFVEQGYEVSTLDIAPKCIERIKENLTNVKAYCKNITEMNFAKASYNIIYAHLTLHYFDHSTTTEIFDKINDLLELKGYFFVKCKYWIWVFEYSPISRICFLPNRK